MFGSVQLGYKDYLFLDLTARNDWSSTFALRLRRTRDIFYYSTGINAVLSEVLTMPEPVSFLKVRASYAKVGNDIPSYFTRPRDYSINGTRNSADQNVIGPNPHKTLRPEDNRSFEVGTEIKFLDNRIGLDATYYINNNYDQFVTAPAAEGEGEYSTWYWNLGNIRNRGVELSLYVTPVKNKLLTWTSTFNFAANRNKIVTMSDDGNGISKDNLQPLTDFGVNMYGLFIKEGGSWGDIYANRVVRRQNGAIVMRQDPNSGAYAPIVDDVSVPNISKVGNPMPKFTLGWNNTIEVKDFMVTFLVDGRFGGKVVSVTQAYLDYYGVTKATADARDQGGIKAKAVNEDGSAFEGAN